MKSKQIKSIIKRTVALGLIVATVFGSGLSVPTQTVEASTAGRVTANPVVRYKDASTNRFVVQNGHGTVEAFCGQRSKPTPGVGTVTQPPVELHSEGVRKALYYGSGGPADIGAHFFVTHVAISQANGDSKVSYPAELNAFKNLIAGLASPPSHFKAWSVSTGGRTQDLVYWTMADPNGTVSVQKVSANPIVTNGNSYYDLTGAVYGFYTDETATAEVGRVTTNASGQSNAIELNEGTYWVKEIAPPKGYAIDQKAYPVTIVSGTHTTVPMQNLPKMDPVAILLRKQDAELGEGQAQGSGSLADAHYTYKFYPVLLADGNIDPATQGHVAERQWTFKTDEDGFTEYKTEYFVSGDDFYFDSLNKPSLPIGTITIQETKAPDGYLLDDTVHVRQIKDDGTYPEHVSSYNTPIVPEQVMRGGVMVDKDDIQTTTPQGGATLENTELSIISQNTNPVVVNGASYEFGETVLKLYTDADGEAQTENNALPVGDYLVRETEAPEGYLILGETERAFTITENEQMVNLNTDTESIKDYVKRGGAIIPKQDIETETPQGGATLNGTRIDIINDNPNPVLVEGNMYATGEVVKTIITDINGIAETGDRLLPYGQYIFRESTPPTGYLQEGVLERTVNIVENGTIIDMSASPIQNQVIRGGVKGFKVDIATNQPHPQGGATLAGTEIEVVNINENPVLIDGVTYAAGEVVKTMVTDETGAFDTGLILPYGLYLVRETKAPEGYLHEGELERTVFVQEDGVTIDLGATDENIKNEVIRGDLEGIKVSDGDLKRLANIPFAITSKTTGESHTVITDANGYFSTAASWNPHTSNTNRGEADTDGVWFGDQTVIDDLKGALPYDTYIIEEQSAKNNEGMKLIPPFEVVINRHTHIVDLGTLTNDYVPVPKIKTFASDVLSGTQNGALSHTTVLSDVVEYIDLLPADYRIEGQLMVKETGEPFEIDGEPIVASKNITAMESEGTTELLFTFDGTKLSNDITLVAFETIYDTEGNVVAEHKDINALEQTVKYVKPRIQTKAIDSTTGQQIGMLSEETKLQDIIMYENLVEGSYKAEGILMSKETGEPLLIGEAQVVQTKEFEVTMDSGEVKVDFIFDGTEYLDTGVTTVVFETIYDEKGNIVAEHKDINDEGQTVTYVSKDQPFLDSEALDAVTGTHKGTISGTNTVEDSLFYFNLELGKKYKSVSELMDAETGEPILKDGKPVIVEKEWTAKEDGVIDVKLEFNGLKYPSGVKTVVFSTVYDLEGNVVAEHKDLEDADQTVEYTTVLKPAPPKTGDDAPFGLALLGLMLGVVGIVFVIRHKLKKA